MRAFHTALLSLRDKGALYGCCWTTPQTFLITFSPFYPQQWAPRPSPTSWSTVRTVPTPTHPPLVHAVAPSGVPATSLPSCCAKSRIYAYTRMQRTMFLSTRGSINCEMFQCSEIPTLSDQCGGNVMPSGCYLGIDRETLSPDYCDNVNGCLDDLVYYTSKDIPTLQPSTNPSNCPSLSPSSSLSVVLSNILRITPYVIFFNQNQHQSSQLGASCAPLIWIMQRKWISDHF